MISVVIPIYYKSSEIITKCFISVLDQQTHTEILVIENADGAGAARNEGLSKATGKYVLFLDGDCVLEPYSLFTMEALLENSDHAFVYGDYYRKGVWEGESYYRSKPFNHKALKLSNYISTMSLVRRKIAPQWDESLKRCNDWDYWLNICLQGYKGYYLNKPIFTAYYTKDDISMSGKEDYEKAKEIVRKKHGL